MTTRKIRGLVPPNAIAQKFKTNMCALNLESQTVLCPRTVLPRRSKSTNDIQTNTTKIFRNIQQKENKAPVKMANPSAIQKMPETNIKQPTQAQIHKSSVNITTVVPSKRKTETVYNLGPSSSKVVKPTVIMRAIANGVTARTSRGNIRRVSRVQTSQRRVSRVVTNQRLISRVQTIQRRVSRTQTAQNTINENTNTTQKPFVPKRPAPYDYKAKFQLLLEKHNELKGKYKETEAELIDKRTQYEQTVAEMNTLNYSNQQLTSQLEQLAQEKESLNKILKEIKANYVQQSTEIEKMRLQMEKEKEINTDLTRIVLKSDDERRRLHNIIQDLKGNIRVFCRVRPELHNEYGKDVLNFAYRDETCLEISSNAIEFTSKRGGLKQEFSFNYVFPQNSTQEQVFSELGQLVHSVLDGYNVCVFAYGQTGSGKTFTMEGGCSSENAGMIPRTVEYLFRVIEQRKILKWTYEVQVTFVEIYNEKIYDLLLEIDQLPHEIRMVAGREGDVYVTNLDSREIHDAVELKKLLNIAQRNRAVAATQMNERSSRSHAITKLEVTAKNSNTGETFHSYLNLVDLAGSERVRDTEITRLTETKNINKSLATLSHVILGLKNKNDHIPYRDSKLTHILMPSLGGNSKTLMFVNISPLTECLNETLNSLRFATMVNSCQVSNAKKNRVIS